MPELPQKRKTTDVWLSGWLQNNPLGINGLILAKLPVELTIFYPPSSLDCKHTSHGGFCVE